MAREIVGEIYLNVKPLDGGVSAGVQQIINKANDQAAKVPVSADTEEANKAVDALANNIRSGIGESWQVAAFEAAKFTATVLGTKAAIEGTVNKLAGLFDQLAQAQAGFTAILGSEQSGQALLDDIREFARVSPFVTQELVNYSQQLLGVGQSAESIVPLLKNTGDLIASVGGDTQNISRVLFTLTQIRSIGRLVGQDAIQLQSSLVPITKLLADFLGKTTAEVKKLQEQGAISADTVFAAISAAGQKVEGAMATATRNISGARSVLSDTFKILLQDSEFLNRVFTDIVEGILAFSDALGSPEIQKNLDRVFGSLDQIYTTIQPLLDAIGETSSKLALDSLNVLAGSLEVLSAVLDAFPAEVLTLIGQGLALLFAVKAPLALLTYVQRLKELSGVFSSGALAKGLVNTANGVQATGQAAETATPALGRVQTAVKNYGTAISIAAIAGGLFIKSLGDGNKALTTFGDTLTGAGFGAQLGAVFGPQGAIVGAGVGAGVGLITSLVNSSNAEAEKRSEELREIGKRTADDFLAGFESGGGINSGQDLDKLLGQTDVLRDQVSDLESKIDELTSLRDTINSQIIGSNIGDLPEGVGYNDLIDQAKTLEIEINKLKDTSGQTTEELDQLFAEDSAGGAALDALREKLSQLNLELPDFKINVANALAPSDASALSAQGLLDQFDRLRLKSILAGEGVIKSGEDLAAVEPILASLGISIDTLFNSSLDRLVILLSEDVPDSLKRTKVEVDALKLAFDEAKKGAAEFFAPFQFQVDQLRKAREESLALSGAFSAIADGIFTQGDTQQFASALLTRIETVTAAAQAAGADAGVATAQGLSVAKAQLDALQDALGLTTTEFEKLLEQLGLLSLYNATEDVDSGFFGSLSALSEQTGIAADSLREILDISKGIDTNSKITVTADVTAALSQLATLQARLDNFPSDNATLIAQINAIKADIEAILGLGGGVTVGGLGTSTTRNLFSELTGGALDNQAAIEQARQEAEFRRQAIDEAQRASEAARERIAREAEQAQREAERLAEQQQREAERVQQMLESAGETISSAMDSAAASIKAAAEAWTASIRERVQEERAVSVERLIGNTSRQAAALEELTAGIETLKARGLSDQAISAIGIDNVADIRQVRRLLNSNPADLQQLSTVVGQRDTNAEILARRQQQVETKTIIVSAILEAARVLGVDLSTERAIQLAGSIDITGVTTTGAQVPNGLLETLLSEGRIVRG